MLILLKKFFIFVVVFDIGLGNMMIDEVCQQFFNVLFDENGCLVVEGKIILEFLGDCMNYDYMKFFFFKLMGRELFGIQYIKRLLENYSKYKKEDLLVMIIMFMVLFIVYYYEIFIFFVYFIDEVIIGGGGSYNNMLMNMIKVQIGKCCSVYI